MTRIIFGSLLVVHKSVQHVDRNIAYIRSFVSVHLLKKSQYKTKGNTIWNILSDVCFKSKTGDIWFLIFFFLIAREKKVNWNFTQPVINQPKIFKHWSENVKSVVLLKEQMDCSFSIYKQLRKCMDFR